MKEYVAMVATQTALVVMITLSKIAYSDGMSSYSFIFYSNALASIVLFPLSLIFHRSPNLPPMSFNVLCGFFIVGIFGFLGQIFGFIGVSYSSVTLGTTLNNLIPSFTFILAIFSRMEAVDFKRSTAQAKFIGTVVSIAGAIIMTLYQGPPILPSPLKTQILNNHLGQTSNWVLGGIILAFGAVFISIYIVSQAIVLKKYPAVMILMFCYCFICTILSGLASLIAQDNLRSFSLYSKTRFFSILYSGIFGSAFQVTVQSWCIRRRGPLFVAMFHPVGIVIAALIGVIFLGDGFYLGSLLGSVTVVIGFYTFMWGKANEEKLGVVNVNVSSKLVDEAAPLLQDNE